MVENEVIILDSSPVKDDLSLVCLSDCSPITKRTGGDVIVELSSSDDDDQIGHTDRNDFDDTMGQENKFLISSLPSSSPSKINKSSSSWNPTLLIESAEKLFINQSHDSDEIVVIPKKPIPKQKNINSSYISDISEVDIHMSRGTKRIKSIFADSDEEFDLLLEKGSNISEYKPIPSEKSSTDNALKSSNTPPSKLLDLLYKHPRNNNEIGLNDISNFDKTSMVLNSSEKRALKRTSTLPSKSTAEFNLEELLKFDKSKMDLKKVNKTSILFDTSENPALKKSPSSVTEFDIEELLNYDDKVYMESRNKVNKTATVSNSPKKRALKRSKTLPAKPADDSNPHEMLNYFKQANMSELKNVNRATRPKEIMLQEMVVTFDQTLKFDQVDSILNPIKVTYDSLSDPLIKWKRHINSKYYKAEDVFIPITPKILNESFTALYYKADDEFVNILQNGVLQLKLQNLRRLNRHHCIILIIEGQDQYLQKIKTKENRNYTTMIRQQFDDQRTTTTATKKLHNIVITKNKFEELLIDLQINHRIHLFPTKNNHDTITWLKLFTYTIASLRYDKFERLSDFANLGIVKSGIDEKDCFLKSLQHFKFVTPLVLEKVFKDYKTISELYYQYTTHGKLGKSYVRESVDNSISKFFKSDNANDLLID